MSTIKSTYIQKVGVGTDAFELPANDGTSGQYLQTNGSGALSWQTVASLSNAEDGTGTDFEFNSGFGSNATAYGCRAWVNFNGTGTVAIRDSGNVSSITDNGTGDYTLNFTNAMPDADYATTGACRYPGTMTGIVPQFEVYNTGSLRFFTYNNTIANYDFNYVHVVIIR